MRNTNTKTKRITLLIAYFARAVITLLLFGIMRIAKVERTGWLGFTANSAALANIPALLTLAFNLLFTVRSREINDKAFPFVSAAFDWGICGTVGAIALCLDYFRAAEESGVGNGLVLLVLPTISYMVLFPYSLLLILIIKVTLQQLQIVE